MLRHKRRVMINNDGDIHCFAHSLLREFSRFALFSFSFLSSFFAILFFLSLSNSFASFFYGSCDLLHGFLYIKKNVIIMILYVSLCVCVCKQYKPIFETFGTRMLSIFTLKKTKSVRGRGSSVVEIWSFRYPNF